MPFGHEKPLQFLFSSLIVKKNPHLKKTNFASGKKRKSLHFDFCSPTVSFHIKGPKNHLYLPDFSCLETRSNKQRKLCIRNDGITADAKTVHLKRGHTIKRLRPQELRQPPRPPPPNLLPAFRQSWLHRQRARPDRPFQRRRQGDDHPLQLASPRHPSISFF